MAPEDNSVGADTTVTHRGQVTLGRVSTSEAIVREVTREILDGRLPAGTFLREVNLAETFGVSRQSLRAAFARLAHLGLLRHEAHRGMRVPVMSKRELRDVYYVRALIESEAICRVSRCPEVWPSIERAVAALEALPRNAEWSDIVEADLAIHRVIVGAVGSPRLLRAYEMIDVESRLAIVPARLNQTKRMVACEHRELLQVIQLGDPEASVARFREHLLFGTEEILARLPDEAP